MRKIYCLDTNVILSDPNALNAFGGNDIIIPSIVLQELDKFKTQMDEIGRNARYFSRVIDGLREIGRLNEGVPLDCGGSLTVVAPPKESVCYDSFLDSSNDNKIIAVAHMAQELNQDAQVIIVSKDTLVRVKADIYVHAEDYQHDKVITADEDKYKGYTELDSDKDFINSFYNKKKRGFVESPIDVPENHFVHLKGWEGKQSAVGRVKDGKLHPFYNYTDNDFVFGVQAKNIQQEMALELLLDPNVPLVTLSGKAGTGKTLIALAAGLKQSIEADGLYNKVIVARPVIPMGKDIGYLPGDMQEKLRPWMQPIFDNLEFLFGCKDSKELEKTLEGYEDFVQVEALTYIRGRSIPNQYIIIDEAQNLTQHEVKTILTRVGEGSKIVLVGDPEQIDHPYLDAFSNGLTYAIEKLKDLKESGHVSLKRGERSTLAQLCADIL